MFFRSFARQVGNFAGRHARPAILGLGIGIVLTLTKPDTVQFYSDKILEKAKGEIIGEIEKMKRKHGEQMMTFPQVNYSFEGGIYKFDFLVDQRRCDIFSLLVVAANIIQEAELKQRTNPRAFQNIKTFHKDNIMTFQIEFNETGEHNIKHKATISLMGEFRSDRPSFKFVFEKQFEISNDDVNIVSRVYEQANLTSPFASEKVKNQTQPKPKPSQAQPQNTPQASTGSMSKSTSPKDGESKEPQPQPEDPVKALKDMGVIVFSPEDKSYLEGLTWDILAGYEPQKRDIEDTVLLSLTHADIFDEITKGTRARFEKNRAKAVLFEGPPGTGKTTSAKIIASQVGIPLLYLPLESVMSKYYGESEKKLADVFELANKMGRSIVFIDEVDALALGRSEESHEVSRRILSTLLRKMDSFESENETLLICATNRKQDLDKAILSRIDLSIRFDLPDVHSRKEIFRRYAVHLDDEKLAGLAVLADKQSGRNIYEVCKDAERRWASKRIRKEVDSPLPPFEQYIESINQRVSSNLN